MNPPPPPSQQPPPPPLAVTFHLSHHPNPQPPPPSLPNALSNLTSLLQHSATVLRSLPTPTASAAASSPALLPCPCNPNHRLPPSSLFSHHLNCPSPLSLPHNFHYPLTLHSTTAISPPSLSATSSDISVSLENYIGYNAPGNNFFYQNCPGPVSPIGHPPLLNLPRVLYRVCADFNKDSSWEKGMGFSVDFIRFLPSEIWAIQSEIEAWGGGFPAVYSSRILRAILRLRDCKFLHLFEWIVSNSPRYGVIVDFAMRDHVLLLVRLCLKVIVREAFELVGVAFSDGELNMKGNVLLGLSNRSFECPRLVEVIMWLALQFSVLFGEANGKYFAVDVLKECILGSALLTSLFPLDQKDVETSELEPVQSIVSINDTERDESGNIKGETVGDSMIFISQVAAAVAALHERSLIEEKIKALRNPQPLSAYQRNMEHAHVSKIADEERQKRPDYRPIIDHDGLLWQRSSNQDTNKVKTREELLAEERDYKRRRMSYRGKKLKRNTLEVTRDIIEEYMEEMKLAGGIGAMPKDVKESKALESEHLNTNASATGVYGATSSEITEENRVRSLDNRKGLHSHHHLEDFKDDIKRPRRDSSLDLSRQDINRHVERIRNDRVDYSWSRDERRSSSHRDERRSSSHSREQMQVREKQDSVEAFGEGSSRRSRQKRSESREHDHPKRNRDEFERNYHRRDRDEHEGTSRKRERHEDYWEKHGDRGRSKTDSARQERDEDNGRHQDKRRRRTDGNSSSRAEKYEFNDRYDPAESHDIYEDDL